MVYERLSGLSLERIYIFPEVDSTNDEAKRRLRGRSSVLVLAERQRRGRGRQGRRWESPPGGLWFSLGFREQQVKNITLLPLLAGVATAQGLRRLGFDARIKWPNDILIDGKKVAGILVEVEMEARGRGAKEPIVIAVGIGINVNIAEKELQGRLEGVRVGTLMGIAGRRVDRLEVLLQVLEGFFHWWALWKGEQVEPILRAWKELSATLGRWVMILDAGGRRIEGTAVDLERDGALVVRTAEGQLRRISEGHLTP